MQSNNLSLISDQKLIFFDREINSQNILPRQGWQDKRAFVKAIIKAKTTLEIAEISDFINLNI